jgi:hypothetical protein
LLDFVDGDRAVFADFDATHRLQPLFSIPFPLQPPRPLMPKPPWLQLFSAASPSIRTLCQPGKPLMPGASGRTRCPAHIRFLRALGYPVQKPLQQPGVLKFFLGESYEWNSAMILLFFYFTNHHKRSLAITGLDMLDITDRTV